MLCFVDRGVLLGGGESVILSNKFFCCFANSQLLVVCMHVCEHTTSTYLRIYMLCFVDRGVLLGGGESVILSNKFFCCFANSQLLVVCMHVCEHTTSHHFNVKIALNISGLGALHTGRDAL